MKKVKPEDMEKVEDIVTKAAQEILGGDAKVSDLSMDEFETLTSKKQLMINKLINESVEDINLDFVKELSTNLIDLTDKAVENVQESIALIDISTSIAFLIQQVAESCEIPSEMLADIVSTLVSRAETENHLTLEQAREIIEKSDCNCEGCSQLRQRAQAIIDVAEGK